MRRGSRSYLRLCATAYRLGFDQEATPLPSFDPYPSGLATSTVPCCPARHLAGRGAAVVALSHPWSGRVESCDEDAESLYHDRRFPAAVIRHAVRWYFWFKLSLRDIEELLFERGVVVSYETILALMLQVRCGFAHRVKAARCKSGSTWPLGEMSVTPCGEPYLLRQVVDQPGAELDILLKRRRNKAAAKQFSKQVLAACPEGPCKIVTDQLHSYPAAKAELSELAHVKHVFVKASARLNNRAENSHRPTRERAPNAWLPSSGTRAGFPVASDRQHFAQATSTARSALP
jgi:putative transposase